ncbi:hypothetical protein DFS34DRAFT_619887 [Phlyctochytrium arcticum]|nr:hypothetical protein DFS34DRAFT_619887 [Phlyctochytrium arcticum]
MADRGATRLKGAVLKPGSGRTSRRPSVTASSNLLNQLRPEGEEHVPEGSVALTIKVTAAKNIKGAKGDHVNSFVRVQLADFDFKDSPVAVDTPNPQYAFVHKQVFHIDEALIDTIANKKIHFTLIESLPKEKTANLGEGDLSMLNSFLKYTPRDPNNPEAPAPPPPPLSFKATVPIVYANPKLLGKDAEDPTKAGPEIEVEVTISRPLIQPEVVENGMFINIKVDDVFPVPDEWGMKEGNEKDLNSNIYTYTLNFMVPAQSTLDRRVSIQGGSLIMTDQAVITDPALTTPTPIMLPKPATTSQNTGAPQADSDATQPNLQISPTSDDPAHPPPVQAPPAVIVEKPEKPQGGETIKKVSWGWTYVLWMPPEAVVRLREKIQHKQMTEVEFTREMQPRFSHIIDANANKYRGRAIFDLSSLLFPRVTGVRGRWPLDVYEPPPSPANDGTPLAQARANMGSNITLDGQHTGPTPPTKKGKPTSNLYKNLGTSLGLEIVLEKPLLDKKKLQPITKSVTDFIPRRIVPPHLLFEKRSKRADEAYVAQLQEIVRKLVKEYEAVLAQEAERKGVPVDLKSSVASQDAQEELQRRKKFFFHLNKSGAYFSFKEQLKGAVVDIVRERFKKKSPFTSKSELQLFMSEIYVYLIDQMHLLINKTFRDRSTLFTDPTISKTADFQTLKEFADVAEADHAVDLAAGYHQERIVKYDDSMLAWFDYGCFCMRNGFMSKGEECYRMILSRNPRHIPSLLAYGALCCVNERFEESRVHLVTAVELQPKYVLGRTLLGLYYDVTGEEEESELEIAEAQKLHKATMPPEAPSIHLSVAEFLIHCHAGQLAERALSQEILATGPKVKPYLLLSHLEIQRGNYKLAADYLKDALNVQQDDPNVWAALGHLQYVQKQNDAAQLSYETVLSFTKDSNDMPLVYMRLGSIHLHQAISRKPVDVAGARMAKSMYLRACHAGPSAASWLGVGRACLALETWDEAEDALAEANVLNNRNAEVWAHLALLNIKQDRSFESSQCIAQALRLGVRDASVLRSAAQALLSANQPTVAVECLRASLELEPDNLEAQHAFEAALKQAGDELEDLGVKEKPTTPLRASRVEA